MIKGSSSFIGYIQTFPREGRAHSAGRRTESGSLEIIDEELKPNATKCKEDKRKKIQTKNVQQIEKQNETKIESQSVPIRAHRAHHKK